ncbi:hypothetical protein PRIPAC_82343 [Pristionchus pacificus]|uniref:DUF7622 domain-containing protein n=1 Tax=Pristionchus pacificus TaxID=54126 RepID=A0A2A6CL41_PRIPA|nr:hypothetical protein PRIPAC_82343 [Pristionchus pacificus]|eukprot:PDM78797.1 hypothetical protein PRIPAC_31376 [Pristionchus pacificus]
MSFSVECWKGITSALIPDVSRSNRTCSGEYCYRAERYLKYLSIDGNETTVIMDCFDFPYDDLRLGCRRNFEGTVLNTDRCNDNEPAQIVDLQIVDCLSGSVFEGSNRADTRKCSSNFCANYRYVATEPNYGLTMRYYKCQEGSVLAKFDLFVRPSFPLYVPAGICLVIQTEPLYMQKCSTPTRYPYDSGLPLDDRRRGMIVCVIRTCVNFFLTGLGLCEGHVCFVKKTPNTRTFGCITYGVASEGRRMPLGAHQMIDNHLYLCDKKKCNMENDEAIFNNLPGFVNITTNNTCDCLKPHGAAIAGPPIAVDIPLVLGITIPVAIISIIIVSLIVFRGFTGRCPFSAKPKTAVIAIVPNAKHK